MSLILQRDDSCKIIENLVLGKNSHTLTTCAKINHISQKIRKIELQKIQLTSREDDYNIQEDVDIINAKLEVYKFYLVNMKKYANSTSNTHIQSTYK